MPKGLPQGTRFTGATERDVLARTGHVFVSAGLIYVEGDWRSEEYNADYLGVYIIGGGCFVGEVFHEFLQVWRWFTRF